MVVVLSSDVLPELRLTVDEYLQADLPEGFAYELVDGVVEMSPNPSWPHEAVVSVAAELFFSYKRVYPKKIGLIAFGSGVLIPGKQRVRVPDIAVYLEKKPRASGWAVWKKHTPVLVVEVVSRGQEKRDYEQKRADYWDAGVAEYWIIDPSANKITVLTRGAKKWRERVFRPGEQFEAETRGLIVDAGMLLSA